MRGVNQGLASQVAGTAVAGQDVQEDRARRRHRSFGQTTERYGSAVTRCRVMLDAVAARDPQAHRQALELARSISEHTGRNDLVSTRVEPPSDNRQLRATQALDAAVIAAAVGRRLELMPNALLELTLGAMLYGVGIEQLPRALQEELSLVGKDEQMDFAQYPLLGAEALERCGGFAEPVLRIVRQHRERQDGRGFPARLKPAHIHPHAGIVGAVREYQLHAVRDHALMPSAALARLYLQLRGAYGPRVVESLIATLTVYPPGTFLALTDGRIGRVMQVREDARLHPTVCLFDGALEPSKAQIVDLSESQTMQVLHVLDPEHLTSDVVDFFGGAWAGIAFPTAANQ